MITRQEVVKEALSWLKTPYALGQMVKGAGIDCVTFLYAVYRACGIVSGDDPLTERYSHDWFKNTNTERYALGAFRHAHKVAEGICNRSLKPEPGNLILAKAAQSKVFNHGGIIIKWPQIIHAVDPEVELTCVMNHGLWSYREVVVLDPWAKQ
jgi:cell wall-associated NlpC family hydrolase